MFCSGCGEHQAEDSMYCSNDGTLLVKPKKPYDIHFTDTRHCRDCGQTLNKTDHFCSSCGTITEHVKLGIHKQSPMGKVSGFLKHESSSAVKQAALFSKESLILNSLAALKLLAFPFVLIWLFAWLARDSMLSSERMTTLSQLISQNAVESMISVGDVFLIINGASLSFNIRLMDFSEYYDFTLQFGAILLIVVMLIAITAGSWLLTRYDRSFLSNHDGLTAVMTGVFYCAGLLLLGMFFGSTTRMNIDGEVVIVSNTYSIWGAALFLGLLIAMISFVSLLIVRYRKQVFAAADQWVRYGSGIVTGLTVGVVAYCISFVMNTLILLNSDNLYHVYPEGMGFWDALLNSPLTAITMFQGLKITTFESFDGERLINTVEIITVWFSDILRQTEELYIYDYSSVLSNDLSDFTPILWSMMIPVFLLVAGGLIMNQAFQTLDWKPIAVASVSTGAVVTLIGLFSKLHISLEAQDRYSMSGYYAQYEIMWFSSFLLVSAIAFAVYYTVNWFKS